MNVRGSSLLLLCLLAGCHGAPSLPTPSREAGFAQKQQELEDRRTQLELVPPPSKSRYLSIRSLEQWENPYLTVQPGMLTLHVLQADANPEAAGTGGLLRPVGARRQELNIAPEKLGEALAAIPQTAWPYGRVVAVEEAHKTPASGEPAVRRNMEATMRTLNDLGVVVAEWTESGPR